MKEIDNKLTQKFDEYPSFGVLKGVKVFVTGTNIGRAAAGHHPAAGGGPANRQQRHHAAA